MVWIGKDRSRIQEDMPIGAAGILWNDGTADWPVATGIQGRFGMDQVKALFFDVFGTLVDWRSSIAREAEASAVDAATLSPGSSTEAPT